MGSEARPEGAGASAESPPMHASLLTNGVTWYLRSSLELAHRDLEVVTPRTVLGFLPIGTRRLDENVAELVGVRLGTKLYPDRLLVAMILALLAVLGPFGPLGAVLLSLGTLAMLLLSFVAVIRFDMSRADPFVVPVCLAHIPRAKAFIAAVERTARSEANS